MRFSSSAPSPPLREPSLHFFFAASRTCSLAIALFARARSALLTLPSPFTSPIMFFFFDFIDFLIRFTSAAFTTPSPLTSPSRRTNVNVAGEPSISIS